MAPPDESNVASRDVWSSFPPYLGAARTIDPAECSFEVPSWHQGGARVRRGAGWRPLIQCGNRSLRSSKSWQTLAQQACLARGGAYSRKALSYRQQIILIATGLTWQAKRVFARSPACSHRQQAQELQSSVLGPKAHSYHPSAPLGLGCPAPSHQ